MVEVKICGVCRADDARVAAESGASYIGVILAPGRTRTRSISEAAVIFDAARTRRVGVFVDASVDDVIATAHALILDAVQLHGDESIETIQRIRDRAPCEVWKAIRVRDVRDIERAHEYDVDALHLDGWSDTAHGGTGTPFDWDAVAHEIASLDRRLVVAGGLTPANVATAIEILRPSIVDVSSGVEREIGIKDHDKVRDFISAARGQPVRAS